MPAPIGTKPNKREVASHVAPQAYSETFIDVHYRVLAIHELQHNSPEAFA